MSAIWGKINFISDVQLSDVEKMSDSMSCYKFDRIEKILQDNIYFSCGHQHATNESVYDVSPIYDMDNNTYFLSDCFLYNREHIIGLILKNEILTLHYSYDEINKLGDSNLAYLAYKTLGYAFVKELRGSFTIAIFNANDNKLHLYTDHLSKHYLAYHIANDYVCFGSVYNPIKACIGKNNLILNHEFIINSYRNRSPMGFVNPEQTVYKDVFHVENATHLTIDISTKKKSYHIYWTPLKTCKRMKYNPKYDYRTLFLETYSSIIHAMLRSRKETGIMLSGGLDSSSVTAFAAPELRQMCKTLFSYTSVPAPGFQSIVNSYIVENESYLIEAQKKFYGNLCPRYICSEKDNCISSLNTYQKTYSIPVKPTINNINIDKMMTSAEKDNCSIMLSGSNGNATISYGSIGEYISLSVLSGHPIRAFKEMNTFCRVHRLSITKYLYKWLKIVSHYFLKKPDENIYYLRDDDVNLYGLNHMQLDYQRKFGTEYYTTHKQRENFLYMPTQYIQRSYFHTQQSLLHGILILDPTLSVEMIELCYSLPLECFVHNGVERRLIKDYMKDLMPGVITDDAKGFGIQAADFAFCVNRDWSKIKDSLYDILATPLLDDYLDRRKINQLIETIRTTEGNLDKETIWDAALIGSLGYFLRDHSENKQCRSTD